MNLTPERGGAWTKGTVTVDTRVEGRCPISSCKWHNEDRGGDTGASGGVRQIAIFNMMWESSTSCLIRYQATKSSAAPSPNSKISWTADMNYVGISLKRDIHTYLNAVNIYRYVGM